jgi:hypothetical protein
MLKVDTQVLESLEDAGQVNEQSLQCDDLPQIQLRPIWGPTRWGQVEGSGVGTGQPARRGATLVERAQGWHR